MKKILFGIVIGLLAGGAGVWLFLRPHAGAPEEKKEEHKEASHVVHGTNGETWLNLDKEAQEHAGLKMAPLQAAELKPEMKAFGRVLDPAPLATAMTDMAAARTQFEASSRELERLKILYAQNQNVSTRAVESAQAVTQRDRVAVEAAQLRFISTWGKSIAGRKDLDMFVPKLIAQEMALVRIDVPPGEASRTYSYQSTMQRKPQSPRVFECSASSIWPK